MYLRPQGYYDILIHFSNENCLFQTSRGAQTSSIMSDSGSFIEDDNHEQLTIQNIDTIKIMSDVEDDVRKQVDDQINSLENELKERDELIAKLQLKIELASTTESATIESDSLKKDENDNFNVPLNSNEDHLEGNGEQSLLNSSVPKLLRLQSIQDQAKAEMKRY